MKRRLFGSWRAQQGQSLAEYGLILALVAIVAISGLTTLGGSISTQLAGLAASIGGVSTGGGSIAVAANPPAASSSGGTANTSEGNCNGCSGSW